MPRFDQSFNGLCEQNLQDTLQLKQRFLDAKNKQRVTGGPKTKHQSEKQKQQATQQQLHNATIQQQQQQDVPNGPPQHGNTASSSIQSSVHVQQFLKRPADELESGGSQGGGSLGQDSSSYEPPVKLQCTTQTAGGHQQGEGGLTKFSVEIVQQLEFTTSAANSQPQQISTNVTVKAQSVKSDVTDSKNSETTSSSAQPGSGNNPPGNGTNTNSNKQNDGNILVDCVKQEPENDFVDLDQCAAALEKDVAANGGTGFGGLSDLIGEDTNDDIITSAAFKELISDITSYPEFMKDFDFEDTKTDLVQGASGNLLSSLKVEDLQGMTGQQVDNVGGNMKNNMHGSPIPSGINSVSGNNISQQNPSSGATTGFTNSTGIFDKVNSGGNRVPPYHPGMEFGKTELSPAAQTLKQMAEQHQHKTQSNQIGSAAPGNSPFGNARGGVLGNASGNNPRSPYHSDFHSPFQGSTAGDYGSPSGPGFASPQIKNSPSFPSPHHPASGDTVSIKQEQQQQLLYQQQGSNPQQTDLDSQAKQRKNLYKQQYSPYGSPAGGHGSPGFLPSRPTPASNNAYGGGTPPRPPSGHGGGPNSNSQQSNQTGNAGGSLQINQAQQLHISQQQGGIQVSAGQQLHLSGELKGNVSIATQQGMHFSQNTASSCPPQQNQPNQGQQQHHQQQNVGPTMGNQQNSGVQQQQSPMHGTSINQQGGMMGAGASGMIGSGGGVGMGLGSPATGSMSHHHHQQHGMPGMTSQQHLQQQQMMNNQALAGDSYSLNQSQTINFTQQTLRQRNVQNPNGLSGMIGGVGPGNMAMAQSGGAGSMQGLGGGMRHMAPHMQQQQATSIMEQKLLHQQMLRQQQQNLMAQQQSQMIRPPPPDYKSSAAGLMQQQGGMAGPNQPRYGSAAALPPSMRRMPHQPMPPSGPMMRPQSMYMMQQHQTQQSQQGMMVGGPLRGMYSNRQPAPMGAGGGGGSLDQMAHTNSPEWRHMMMTQQQSTQFQQGGPGMRGPQFQHTQSQGFGVSAVMGSGNGNIPGGGSIQQMSALQQQQHMLRQQQQNPNGGVMGNVMGGGSNQGMGGLLGQQSLMGGPQSMGGGLQGMGAPPNMSQVQANREMVQQQHLLLQQQQTLLQQQQQINSNNGSQISINNIHMQQNQSISMSSNSSGPGMQQGGMHSNSNALTSGSFNPQSTDDFNLDFLANIPGSDGAFTEQELLNSFDSDAGFNLDIL